MCRSKAEGGRRCPGGAAGAPAPRVRGGKVSRDETGANWARTVRALHDAESALGGGPLANRSALLLGPLTRQARHAAAGGDPSVYDEDVALGRQLLTGLLTGDGDSPETASEKTRVLADAWATWRATPEVP